MPRISRRPPVASKRRLTSGTRSSTHTTFSRQGEPLVVPHEKHALIQAHASARENVRRGWGWGSYIGIIASCLVVVSGWWLTLDTNIHTNIDPVRDPLVQMLDDGTREVGNNMHNASGSVRAIENSITGVRQEFERARLQAEREQVSGTSTRRISETHTTSSSSN